MTKLSQVLCLSVWIWTVTYTTW